RAYPVGDPRRNSIVRGNPNRRGRAQGALRHDAEESVCKPASGFLDAPRRRRMRVRRRTIEESDPMKTRAAVAWEAGTPLSIEEVDLEGPRAGEVLVRIVATGVCHTDAYTLPGADPEGLFPAIRGHEGGGIVEDAGAGVTSVKPGDHVIPLYTPECGQCKFCRSGKTNLCQAIRATQGKGLMPDGSSRFSIGGRP